MCKEFFDYLKEHSIAYKEENGNIIVGSWLDLSNTNIKKLPDNLVVSGYLDLYNTKVKTLPDTLVVGGSLHLSNTNIKTFPDNLVVGGSLDLRYTNIKTLPDTLVVGGSLHLSNTNIKTLPDNLVVGGWLDLRYTNIKTLPDNLVVGGWLDLRYTNIKTLPDNLVVGGSLHLSNTNIKTFPDNLVVGGSLDLRYTNIKTLPDNLVVGGWLDLTNTNIKTFPDNLVVGGIILGNNIIPEKEIRKKEYQEEHFIESKLSWRNGKYRVFDGIFCEVLEQRKNVFKVKIKNKVSYVVTDGINYSHGGTIKEAKKDLIYKLSNRDTSAYEGWTLDTKITKKEAIESYRVITGACEFGTKNFVESLDKIPRKITPAVVIKLTEGQYGYEKYKEFFEEV